MAKATKASEKKKTGSASRRKRGSSAPKAKAKAGRAKKPSTSKDAKKPEAPVEKGQVEEAMPAPADAAANAAFAGQAAMAGTQAAGKALTLAAAEAKGPLVAAGGLAAGVAGGLALVNRRRGRRRAKGFDLAGAAERVGALGEEVGRVAIVIQRAADGSKGSK
jgi:hypothetical protein